jgi:hypothetical protein
MAKCDHENLISRRGEVDSDATARIVSTIAYVCYMGEGHQSKDSFQPPDALALCTSLLFLES